MIIWFVSLPALVVLLVLLAFADHLLLALGKAGLVPPRSGAVDLGSGRIVVRRAAGSADADR